FQLTLIFERFPYSLNTRTSFQSSAVVGAFCAKISSSINSFTIGIPVSLIFSSDSSLFSASTSDLLHATNNNKAIKIRVFLVLIINLLSILFLKHRSNKTKKLLIMQFNCYNMYFYGTVPSIYNDRHAILHPLILRRKNRYCLFTANKM